MDRSGALSQSALHRLVDTNPGIDEPAMIEELDWNIVDRMEYVPAIIQ